MGILLVIPGVVALGAMLGGAARAGGPWLDVRVILGAAASAAVCGALIASSHDPEVGTWPLVQGIALGAGLMGVAPVLAYYALGRLLVRYPIALGLAFVVSVLPLYYYLFAVYLLSLDLAACTPDAYECPV